MHQGAHEKLWAHYLLANCFTLVQSLDLLSFTLLIAKVEKVKIAAASPSLQGGLEFQIT